MFGKSIGIPHLGGWNGFMEKITEHKVYFTSAIIAQPFINAPPSDYNTVYTTLLHAAEQCEKKKQQTCFITFDQPLYKKAREILSSSQDPRLASVIVRLGGFHLLMSFLGAIGYIMSGSGLRELLILIHAPATVDKMMTGHAYSRAIRGHMLVHLALGQVILKMVNFTEGERMEMEEILMDMMDGGSTPMFADEPFKTILQRIQNQLETLQN